ncbi:MAG: hypothetical protein ACXWL2_01565 [Candidatus Chromulinivorax sp.]
MYSKVICISLLVFFSLQASNRDKWELYPFVQRKIDEILEKTDRADHGENKLFAVFKFREDLGLMFWCVYGSDFNKPFVDIIEDEEYQIIRNDRVRPIVSEITIHLADKLSSSERSRFIDACKKNKNGVHIDGFRRPTQSEKDDINLFKLREFKSAIDKELRKK